MPTAGITDVSSMHQSLFSPGDSSGFQRYRWTARWFESSGGIGNNYAKKTKLVKDARQKCFGWPSRFLETFARKSTSWKNMILLGVWYQEPPKALCVLSRMPGKGPYYSEKRDPPHEILQKMEMFGHFWGLFGICWHLLVIFCHFWLKYGIKLIK